jgi:hypothetical protein
MQFYDTLPADTKGIRCFSLLHKGSGFVGSFFLIDETTLPQILKLLDREVQVRIVETLMSQCPEAGVDRDFLDARLGCESIFPQDLARNKQISHALWHLLFDVAGLETVNRKFRYMIFFLIG